MQERDDHYDGEHKYAERFEPLSAYGEFVLQTANPPLDELVGRPDYERAEKIEGGVEEGSDEGEGGGSEGGDYFRNEEDDVGYYIDLVLLVLPYEYRASYVI